MAFATAKALNEDLKMNRAIQLCEVFEVVHGDHAEVLGAQVQLLHLVIWRGAFDNVTNAFAWGEDMCRKLRANYPERQYDHRSYWVAFPYG